MRFGYFTLTDNPPAYGPARRDPNALLNDVHAECLLAEELGFNSVWVPEHHFGFFGCRPTPAVYLAHLAAKRAASGWRPPPCCCPAISPCGWRKSTPCWICSVMAEPSFPPGAAMTNGVRRLCDSV
jgi:hypothetical protein